MKILLWAHSETFKPAWREAEISHLRKHASRLLEKGHEVAFGHPLAPIPPGQEVVHVFGSGHFETLHWLKPHCREIWFSPFPLSVKDLQVSQPEPRWLARLKAAWRGFRRPQAPSLTDHFCLALPSKYVACAWAVPELERWGIPRDKIEIHP